jgi:hypothetical protein
LLAGCPPAEPAPLEADNVKIKRSSLDLLHNYLIITGDKIKPGYKDCFSRLAVEKKCFTKSAALYFLSCGK